jgi:hypothetical protein
MRIIGCDLHARQQALTMLDSITGEVVNLTLLHEGNGVREFYSKLPRPMCLGVTYSIPLCHLVPDMKFGNAISRAHPVYSRLCIANRFLARIFIGAWTASDCSRWATAGEAYRVWS